MTQAPRCVRCLCALRCQRSTPQVSRGILLPAMITLPHFMGVDAAVAAAVEGMRADPKRHGPVWDTEPRTGITVRRLLREQENLWVETWRFNVSSMSSQVTPQPLPPASERAYFPDPPSSASGRRDYTTLHYDNDLLHYTTLHKPTLHKTTLHYTLVPAECGLIASPNPLVQKWVLYMAGDRERQKATCMIQPLHFGRILHS